MAEWWAIGTANTPPNMPGTSAVAAGVVAHAVLRRAYQPTIPMAKITAIAAPPNA
jgi:hypothetical protein